MDIQKQIDFLRNSGTVGIGINRQAADTMTKMRDAMQEFVDRCDRGEILSKYTYAKFKTILEPPKE